MLPVILKQDWFMAKIDLKDAYLTIPVAAVHHPLLSFQVLAGEWIQFQSLPFGLCTAPFVFSKVTKPLVQFLRQLGIYITIYLDDLLIASPGKPQLLEDLSTVFWLFTALGFLINLPKSITEPTQSIEFLGFVIDSAQMTVTLPPHKVESIQKEASQILTLETVQIKTLAHLIGTLVATKPAIPLAPLHFHSLQDLKVQTLRCHKASYHTTVHLSQEAQRDLQWWATQLPTHCSNSIVKTEASVVIESDVSKSGWGAICQGVSTGGKWTAGKAASHINYLELTAAFLALQSFTKDLNNVGVLIRMDNRTAIAQINKMGGPTLSPLCCLALEIWEWCQARNITPHAEYLPGVDNVSADWESRHHMDSSDWQLLPSVFSVTEQSVGSIQCRPICQQDQRSVTTVLQLEAGPSSHSSGRLLSAMGSRTAISFPTIQFDWESSEQNSVRGSDMCVSCSPEWPAQVWYPQLLSMLVINPILLPMTQDLLMSPDQLPHPLVMESRMPLAAWLVSGRDLPCRDFQKGLPICSSNLGESTLTHHIAQPGKSGVAGVLQGRSIHFQPL